MNILSGFITPITWGRSPALTLTASSLRALCRNQGLGPEPVLSDSLYVVLPKTWVLYVALPKYHRMLEHLTKDTIDSLYSPKFDCDDFARGFAWFCALCHRVTDNSKIVADAPAVGYGYTMDVRDLPPLHASVLVAATTHGGMKLCGIEAQEQGPPADYGVSSLASCWHVSF